MENRGVATVTIITDAFLMTGQLRAKSLGMESLPVVVIPHPIAGLKPEEMKEKADSMIQQLIDALTSPVKRRATV